MGHHDVLRFKEPVFQHEDVSCFEACLLVKGMVCARFPKGDLDEDGG